MPIQKRYTKGAGDVIASYDYTDIAEGTGIVAFNLLTSEDTTAADYHLSENAIPSVEAEKWGRTQSATTVQLFDWDFDLFSSASAASN